MVPRRNEGIEQQIQGAEFFVLPLCRCCNSLRLKSVDKPPLFAAAVFFVSARLWVCRNDRPGAVGSRAFVRLAIYALLSVILLLTSKNKILCQFNFSPSPRSSSTHIKAPNQHHLPPLSELLLQLLYHHNIFCSSIHHVLCSTRSPIGDAFLAAEATMPAHSISHSHYHHNYNKRPNTIIIHLSKSRMECIDQQR